MNTKTLLLVAGLGLSTTGLAEDLGGHVDNWTGSKRDGFYAAQVFIWDSEHKGGGYTVGGGLESVLVIYPDKKRKTVFFNKHRYDNAEDCLSSLYSTGGIACAKVEFSFSKPPLGDAKKKGVLPYYVPFKTEVLYFVDDLGQKHKFLDTLKTSNYR